MPTDARRNYISYTLKGRPVRSKGDLSGFSPPLYSSEGTTGWCGWRTIYQVATQNRNIFFSNSPPLSLDFIAAMWCLNSNISVDNQVYGIAAFPRAGFGLLRTYGTVPFSVFGNGVRVPTAEELAAALEYRPANAYDIPYYHLGTPEQVAGVQIALTKEIIDSGFALCGEAMGPPFPYNGGVMPPTPLGITGVGHAFTIDQYDDAGFNGAGLVGGSTNGVGRWSMRYADFNNYCSPSCFVEYVDPPTYPFPPLTTGNAMLKDQAIAAWTALDPTRVTQAQKDALAAFAAQLTVGIAVPPPVVTPPPVVPIEHIVNNLPVGQRGTSGAGAVEFTGVWTASSTAGRYNNDGVYSCTTPTFPDPAGTPLSTYTFRSPPLQAGKWKVYLWWAQYQNRSTRVPITVGGITAEWNQQINGSKWNQIAELTVAEGEVATVTISNANGQAAADAVRFVQVV